MVLCLPASTDGQEGHLPGQASFPAKGYSLPSCRGQCAPHSSISLLRPGAPSWRAWQGRGEPPPLVPCSARLPLTSAGGKAAYVNSLLLPETVVLLFL